MAERIGTLLNPSGDGGEEVLIVSRGKERTRFRRRDELGWNFRVESTGSENVIERKPQPKPASKPTSKPARRASRPRGQRVAYVRVSAADQNEARQLEAVGECDRVYVEVDVPGTMMWTPKGIVHHGPDEDVPEGYRAFLVETRAAMKLTAAGETIAALMETGEFGLVADE